KCSAQGGCVSRIAETAQRGIREKVQASLHNIQTGGFALLMKKLIAVLTAVMLAAIATSASAQIRFEITEGNRDATPIAVAPFARQGAGLPPDDLAEVVDSDLARSGQFLSIPRTDMLGSPSVESEVFYRDWRSI